ncbi:MFS transporter [Paenibacillus sp. LMG 31460]|uniref:MFS transporter n=1 Tax=Paenibacillus germinis TaxID=2654979 RepID=A0ABX1ZGL4_9BACL|nr:MFS transporter [Paenibacillus germinis]NOU91371.1 MFS transporter [Paenibacillus germinis]
MNNTWKIYMLTLISFLVGTSQFVISGILDEIATSVGVSLSAAGRQAGAMSNVSLGFSASLVFGVPIGRVVAAVYDWKVIFWGIGLFTLIGIFAVAKVIPSTKGEASVPLGKQLALLKTPKIATALGVTFFVFVGYSVVNTYITPFLTSVMSLSGGVVSVILFVLGIASLIGSKLGGFLADRNGTARTLVISMFVQALSLALLSIAPGPNFVGIPLLILWTIAAWTFGPTQNFNLLSLAPEAPGIMLSINSTFVQLGFAVGAGIGGVTVGRSSILSICWIGAVAVAAAVVVASVSCGLTRTLSKRAATE